MTKGNSLIKAISVGFALIVVHAFLYFNIGAFSPDQAELFRAQIAIYIIVLAFVFAFDSRSARRTESPLFTASFFSAQGIVKFLIAVVATLVFLIPLGFVVKGSALPSIFEVVSNLGWGLILVQAFIVAFDEELIFRGFITNELTSNRAGKTAVAITQAVLFAFFHLYASGGNWIVMSLYIPLGLIFLEVKNRFSPKTQMANIGVHFAWNIFVLGFVQGAIG